MGRRGRPAELMPPPNSPSNAPAKSSPITRLWLDLVGQLGRHRRFDRGPRQPPGKHRQGVPQIDHLVQPRAKEVRRAYRQIPRKSGHWNIVLRRSRRQDSGRKVSVHAGCSGFAGPTTDAADPRSPSRLVRSNARSTCKLQFAELVAESVFCDSGDSKKAYGNRDVAQPLLKRATSRLRPKGACRDYFGRVLALLASCRSLSSLQNRCSATAVILKEPTAIGTSNSRFQSARPRAYDPEPTSAALDWPPRSGRSGPFKTAKGVPCLRRGGYVHRRRVARAAADRDRLTWTSHAQIPRADGGESPTTCTRSKHHPVPAGTPLPKCLRRCHPLVFFAQVRKSQQKNLCPGSPATRHAHDDGGQALAVVMTGEPGPGPSRCRPTSQFSR